MNVRFRPRHSLWSCTFAVMLGASIAAQATHRFDPSRDLDGFTARRAGAFRHLHDFERFGTRTGDAITVAELAELRRSWVEHIHEVDVRIDWYTNDPIGKSVGAVEAKLRKHPFFRHVDYEVHYEQLPFVFFVQRPSKDREGYARGIINKHLPFLKGIEAAFLRDFVTPNGLERNPELTCYAIAVLADPGAYSNYANAVQADGLHSTAAHYDPDLRLAVTYKEFGDASTKQHPILHEFVHALQHAHYVTGPAAGGVPMPRPIWFNEGLAEFRTDVTNSLSSIESPRPNVEHLWLYAELLSTPTLRYLCSPLRSLVATDGPGYAKVVEAAAERGKVTLDERGAHIAIVTFYAQAHLLVHYLNVARDGLYRTRFQQYVGKVMRGEHGFEPFAAAFEGVDLEALERDFQKDCLEQRGELAGLRTIAPGARAKMLRDLQGAQSSDVAAAEASARFDPSVLAISASDAGARVAVALDYARRGMFAEALAALPAAADRADPRVERERARLTSVREYRDRLLAEVQRTGKVLRLTLPGGRRAHGKLLELGTSGFRLEYGTAKFDVDFSEVDPSVLEQIASKVETKDRPGAWMKTYFDLLAGGSVQPMRADDELGRGLAEDAAGFASLIASGAPAALLASLAEPIDADDAESRAAALRSIEGLMGSHRTHPLVLARLDGLRDYARSMLAASFDGTDAASLGLRGAYTAGGAAGNFELRYDFRDPAQAQDFVDCEDRLPELRETFGRLVAASTFHAAQGTLTMRGQNCKRLVLPFRGPFRVRWKAAFLDLNFALGVCDRSTEANIACFAMGNLIVRDIQNQLAATLSSSEVCEVEKVYEFELHHDGKSAMTCSINGRKIQSAQNLDTLTGGHLWIWSHCNEDVRISDLRIEGQFGPAELAALRTGHVDAALARIFGT